MHRYAYKVFYTGTEEALESLLNDYAREGWVVEHITHHEAEGAYGWYVVLRRDYDR